MPGIKDVLFNDGEGIDADDLNNAQRWPAAVALTVLSDTGRASLGAEAWSRSATSELFCMGSRHGAPLPNNDGDNRVIELQQGWLFQRLTGEYDPSDSVVLGYHLDGADTNRRVTHAVGHATLPRWDLVAARISRANGPVVTRDFKDDTTGALTSQSMSVERSTEFETVLVAGTPASTPVIPSVPADMLPLYAVYVPAAFDAQFTAAHIIDYRMPLGVTVVDVYAADMLRRGSYVESGGTMTVSTGGAFPPVVAPAAGNQIVFVPPMLASGARLLSVGCLMDAVSSAAGSHTIETFSSDSGYGAGSLINSLGTGIISASAPANSLQFKRIDTATRANSQLVGSVASPIWSNGLANPDPLATAAATMRRVGVRWTSGTAGDAISLVRFVFAGLV